MDQAPFILELVTKGGVVGILCIIIAALGTDWMRMRKAMVKLYAERDGYRLRYALYKNECRRANISVDESALQPIPEASSA